MLCALCFVTHCALTWPRRRKICFGNRWPNFMKITGNSGKRLLWDISRPWVCLGGLVTGMWRNVRRVTVFRSREKLDQEENQRNWMDLKGIGFLNKPETSFDVSTRKLAIKLGISQAYVRKILKKAGVIYRKWRQAPHLTPKQVKTQAQRLRRLARQLMSAAKQWYVVMDDECYFTFADDNAPGNKGNTSGGVAEVPQKVRFWQKSKF